MKIFLDCDGVLADFDRHFFDLFGAWPRSLPDDELWAKVQEVEDFWLTIPKKWGADRLWALAEPFDPVILTGCPKSHYELAAAQKVSWGKANFGEDVSVLTCLSRNKPQFMTAPNDVLVDDFRSNIRRWTKAGGIAIHYRNIDQAIDDLSAIIEGINAGNEN